MSAQLDGPDPRQRELREKLAQGIVALLTDRLDARNKVLDRRKRDAASAASAARDQRKLAEKTEHEAGSLRELAREKADDARTAAARGDANAAALRAEAEKTERDANKLARDARHQATEADELEKVEEAAAQDLESTPPGAAGAVRELRALLIAEQKLKIVFAPADETPPVYQVETLGGARPFSTNEIAVRITERAYFTAAPEPSRELLFIARREAVDARFVPVE